MMNGMSGTNGDCVALSNHTQGGARGFAVSLPPGWCVLRPFRAVGVGRQSTPIPRAALAASPFRFPRAACVEPFQGGWRRPSINPHTQGGARGFAVSLPPGWCVLRPFRSFQGFTGFGSCHTYS